MGNDNDERTSLLREHYNQNSALMPPLPTYQESVASDYLSTAPPYSDINNQSKF